MFCCWCIEPALIAGLGYFLDRPIGLDVCLTASLCLRSTFLTFHPKLLKSLVCVENLLGFLRIRMFWNVLIRLSFTGWSIAPAFGLLLYSRRVYRDLPVRSFIRVPTPSPLYRLHFVTWLSRNFTHVFTNIISCTSSNMGITGHTKPPPNRGLPSPETASTALQTSFLNRLSQNFTRVHKNHLLYKLENGHHRSHITSSTNRGLLPPWKFRYLRFWWNLNHMY